MTTTFARFSFPQKAVAQWENEGGAAVAGDVAQHYRNSSMKVERLRKRAREKIKMRDVALKARLFSINNRLADENRRPLPDSNILQGLKRVRLRLKDEVHTLSR